MIEMMITKEEETEEMILLIMTLKNTATRNMVLRLSM